ncbi:hypothetical protein CA603_31615 [Paraburkholderia hospita]|nr:hypothetical protein CA603_31615 [Paraburkholderia hospita]
MGDKTSSVIPFPRARVTTDDRKHRPGECSHHHIKLDTHGGIVTCRDCGTSLTPFWALSMLADQYALAVAQIDRLQDRVSRADARILELSRELDQHVETERARKTAPDAP